MENNTNNSVNANTNTMNITTTIKTPKTTIELINAVENNNGVKSEFVVVDGIKMGLVSYNSEEDRQRAMDALNIVAQESEERGMELCTKIMDVFTTQAALAEQGISAKDSEEMVIDGIPVIINYKVRKAYIPGVNQEAEEISNMEDLTMDMPEEAIKAILVERTRTAIAEIKKENDADALHALLED